MWLATSYEEERDILIVMGREDMKSSSLWKAEKQLHAKIKLF